MTNGHVIIVGGDYLGRGDQRLGTTLAGQFFRALARREEELPSAIVFLNSGVRLMVDGSPVLQHLQDLESRGVDIVACRTSVEHYDLEDKLEVGDSKPMAQLLELLLADNTLTI